MTPPSSNSAKPVYLDANATEPLRPSARAALLKGLEMEGNPASVHAPGRQARALLEEARTRLAQAFGREADSVVFTSGGTEADSLAVHALGAVHGRRVILGATEHAALHGAARAEKVPTEILPVDRAGRPDPARLREMLGGGPPALVCVMAANNETGVVSPLAEIAAICREAGAQLHVDAVQAAGRLPWGSRDWNADVLREASLAVSGHKMGGIMGAGALILPHDRPLMPLLPGGGQERGRRGGTPALPALLAMVAALAESRAQDWQEIAGMRDELQARAVAAGALVAGVSSEEGAGEATTERLPNTLSLILPGVSGQTQLMLLDLAGFAVSAGSACSSGKVTSSPVLEAMGYGAQAGQAIRVSLPWNVKPGEVLAFGQAYVEMAQRLRARQPAPSAGVGRDTGA
ncbi:cysteine desulfurase family protein [Oecophyllibacter saccharovorans]|uniref:cysteine desulfurase family protein n=1 Tax=Oecophyllibacter saccharovorans TaxID=2558360 RepID=UPI0011745FE3|nr:aminotransferase class V-fold PLP-dependent enzyme [Oecophyllibacter saccharovorans]TPW36260.1 aminotransferase class V-fold PLP-dependent enzyme [Oecophyllibacter saccharovorans]